VEEDKKIELGMNGAAARIADEMEERADMLGVSVSRASCGAKLIDAGINSPGSPEAGKMFSEACLGGGARVTFGLPESGRAWLPCVTVTANEPARFCMASQYAGWAIRGGACPEFFALGSGPARALYGAEEIFKRIGYAESSERAVIALETRSFPPGEALVYIAASCRVAPENLIVLLAPTASVVGCVQVAARIVETGLHKLYELGFDIRRVSAGWGTSPVAPVAANDALAIGWTNDVILYGGRVWYTADCEDEDIERIIDKLPANSSIDYGTPFYDLLKRYDWDFYKIDPMLFSPAVFAINNARTGRVFRAGATDDAMLERLFGPRG
jgi:methenyltetrahydromethanopterin cyclohydrolase